MERDTIPILDISRASKAGSRPWEPRSLSISDCFFKAPASVARARTLITRVSVNHVICYACFNKGNEVGGEGGQEASETTTTIYHEEGGKKAKG